MPGLKRTSTYLTPGGAKRARKGKKTTTAISTSIPRSLNLRKQVLAPSMRTTLRYCRAKTIVASGTGAISAWVVFRMSPYDSEYAIGGQQPRGYNQLELLYHDYVVDSVSIEARFISNINSHRGYPFIVARGDPDASINWNDINENPDRVIAKRPLMKETATDDPGIANTGYLQMTVVPRKMLGITDPNDSRMVTNVEANPEEDYYFLVGACDPHATATAHNVQVSITLMYNVRFLNPKSLNPSA